MTLKCIIPGTNIKTFAKAVNSLSRIGNELFLEFDSKDGLSIQSINSTKSAFASFKFHVQFFTDYDVPISYSSAVISDSFNGKCKVSMKACLNIFKNMRQVEYCQISFDSNSEKLIIILKCDLDTKKKFTISILDIEILQAAYTSKNAPNKVTGSYKIFSEISNNFQMMEEELTLDAECDTIVAKNYVEGSVTNPNFMRSQLSLNADEFERYSVTKDASITFCLREFRAFLHFIESINLDLTFSFEEAGKPCVFSICSLEAFEGNLVLSTLSADDVTFFEQSYSERVSRITKKKNIEDKRKNIENDKINKSKKHKTNEENSKCSLNGITAGDLEFYETIDTELRDTISPNLLENNNAEIQQEHEDYVPVSPNAHKRIRTVFSRCFEKTYIPTHNPTDILAKSSDTED